MRILPCLVLLFVGTSAIAQSKKDIKKNKIKAITEQVTDYVGGKEITKTDSYKKYNKEGQVVEEVEYDKNGKFKRKIVSKYNEFDDKTEEAVYDAENKLVEREVYKYDSYKEKSEVLHYNERNELDSKAVYVVNSNGLKTERRLYDTKGKLLQVKKYIYAF